MLACEFSQMRPLFPSKLNQCLEQIVNFLSFIVPVEIHEALGTQVEKADAGERGSSVQ
jgi:hypothetical protein